jgi:tetratricopeptide (TPR) repeat protein
MMNNADSAVADAVAAFQAGDLDRARALAELQLDGRLGSPQLQHLIGLIDCRLGRLDAGIEWLRRASDAEPANAGFRIMLVRALVDARQAREALAVASAPAGVSPADLALWYARAEAADAAEDRDASAEAWRVICSLRPRDWRAWTMRGNALASLGKWGEAADVFRRAVEINPSEEWIRRNFANALRRAGQKQEALAQIDVLVRQTPASLQLRFERAQCLEEMGQPAESLRELEETARLAIASAGDQDGPGLIRVASMDGEIDFGMLRSLALLLERTNHMDSLARLLDEAEQQGIAREKLAYPAAVIALRQGKAKEAKQLLLQEKPELEPARWHRLMSKIGESLGDPAVAFSEADAMNRSVEDFDEWRKKGAAFRQHIRSLAQTFTREWLASVPVLRTRSRPDPVFLVGFPRSGTTLLDTFLMGHPDVRVLEEVPMLAAAQKTIGAMIELPRCSQAQVDVARSAYWEELDRRVPADFSGLVIDKLPMNMLALPLIYSMFPDARVIFAQRHPLDAVLSGFMQSFVLNDTMASFLDIHDAADLYDGAMTVFTRVRDLVPLKFHTSVYEELVLDPEQSLRPLIEFLGLDWRGELLNHQRTARERGAIVTPSYDQITEPLSRAPSGRWKRYQAPLTAVLPVLLPWAERLGYAD